MEQASILFAILAAKTGPLGREGETFQDYKGICFPRGLNDTDKGVGNSDIQELHR
jgi:hypothetical protein